MKTIFGKIIYPSNKHCLAIWISLVEFVFGYAFRNNKYEFKVAIFIGFLQLQYRYNKKG